MATLGGQQHQFYLTMDPATTVFRRPHKKSRAGCKSCKLRRIKCDETKPDCRNCASKGKNCQYPDPPNKKAHADDKQSQQKDHEEERSVRRSTKRPPPSPRADLSAVPNSFTLHDLKLFHHFLSFAYPSLPLGSKTAWTKDIPQLIHQSDHLMHALLALSASHIASLTNNDLDNDRYMALQHKGRAITGLKKSFAKERHSSLEYDEMLASCYALSFQSALLPDSALDFSTFVRGCALVTGRIQSEGTKTVFNLPTDSNRCPTRPTMSAQFGAAVIPPGTRLDTMLKNGLVALRAAHEVMADMGERQNFYLAIESTFLGLCISPGAGYHRFLSFYAVWYRLAEMSLVFSMESVHETVQLLWSYFLGLHLFIVLVVDEFSGSKRSSGKRLQNKERSDAAAKMTGMVEWLRAIETNLPTRLQTHLAWPRLVSDEVIYHFNLPVVSRAWVGSKVENLRHLRDRSHNVLGSILELSASVTNWTDSLLSIEAQVAESVSETEGRGPSTELDGKVQMNVSHQVQTGHTTDVDFSPSKFVLSDSPVDPETPTNVETQSETHIEGLIEDHAGEYGSAYLETSRASTKKYVFPQDPSLDLSILDDSDLLHMQSRLGKIVAVTRGKD